MTDIVYALLVCGGSGWNQYCVREIYPTRDECFAAKEAALEYTTENPRAKCQAVVWKDSFIFPGSYVEVEDPFK